VGELPTGTVTFLFTDLEGSTRLWEEHPEAMKQALARHDEILRDAITTYDGHIVKMTGDGAHAVFADANNALAAAVDAQRGLGATAWEATGPLHVRMGIHTGRADQRDGDYYGTTVNRAARVMSAGHGGQVLVSDATQVLVRDTLPEDCSFIELGEHRLRDLGRPERLFQLAHPALQRDFGQLRTLDAFPGNLPVQVSSFIGRADDLERVADALVVSPVVTLTGVGGVGKTRLALQVAAEVLPRFPDGGWLCELQAVRDPDAVIEAVAAVFRVTARPGMSVEESLLAYLRDQQLLIVLDNCEHLLRPVAELVARVEASCPGVRVLATSREGLNLRGEQILVVPSLGVPRTDMDLAALSNCEAVRLFVDRARAVKADFAVETNNADGVTEICRRLDGVPLAIELAAARVSAMNPTELARRLDRRFRLLTGGERVAIERHQTLRAAIDWSYELLTVAEQALLARVAVFAGGWTLEAAEAVGSGDPIDEDEVFELLAGLVARSLVVAHDQGAETRYRLLETIRQYGEERLAEAGETDRVRLRHAEYYAQFAGVVASHIYGPDQVEWGARLARERENVLAAMAYALDTENVDLAFTLFLQVPATGVQIDDLVVFDSAPLLALPGATDHPGSALALMWAGFRAWRLGDAQSALALSDESLAAQQRLGPTPSSRHAVIMSSELRGMIAQAAGATNEAVEHLLEAARLARAAEIPALAAIYLAVIAQGLAWSDPEAARAHATEGLALARRTGMPYAIAYNLFGLAQAHAATDPEQARALLLEALQLGATLRYESPNELASAIFTAARLAEWSVLLGVARRFFRHYLQTGSLPLLYLAAIVNLVARALAPDQSESAAVLQGAVTAMLRELPSDIAAPVSGHASGQNEIAVFVAAVRHDTTELLRATLGETRLRELRGQGATMDPTQACTYARTRIDANLPTTNPTSPQSGR
jgi:predicted ATPase/class 3 adenylate cyclase